MRIGFHVGPFSISSSTRRRRRRTPVQNVRYTQQSRLNAKARGRGGLPMWWMFVWVAVLLQLAYIGISSMIAR